MNKDYLTRKDLAELMGIVADRVGMLDREGRLPCKSSNMTIFDVHGKARTIKIYPKKPMIAWIEKGGHRLDYKKKEKKKEESIGITFKQMFAGHFLPKSKKDLLQLQKVRAKTNKPKTKTVRVKGDWHLK
jgi:hypothetical protein